ncbi:MAG: hypothetical protein R2851_20455 [Caldilineaceae bacterium]
MLAAVAGAGAALRPDRVGHRLALPDLPACYTWSSGRPWWKHGWSVRRRAALSYHASLPIGLTIYGITRTVLNALRSVGR